jgi:hypothetical protein
VYKHDGAWVPNGNVQDYQNLGHRPITIHGVLYNSKSYRTRVSETFALLLLNISLGMLFLHSLEIVLGIRKGCGSVPFSDAPPQMVVFHNLPFQDNILVEKSGCARLDDFEFTGVAGRNCTEASTGGFEGFP